MEKINTFWKILSDFFKEFGLIFLYFLVNLSLSLFFPDSQNTNDILKYTLSNILINLILLIIFLLIFRKDIIAKWNDYQKKFKTYFKKSFIIYFIGLFFMIISYNIINVFYNMPLNELANRQNLLSFPISSLINILIIAPIVEELLTRIILKRNINNKYIYIILSGSIFGFLHIFGSLVNGITYELLYLIPYSAIGIALSLIYYKTDNIWTSISFHALHNLICLILIFGGIA